MDDTEDRRNSVSVAKAKTSFFDLNQEANWVPVESGPNGENAGGPEAFEPSVIGHVDLSDYFPDGLWTEHIDCGAFNLLRMKLAPNFTIPRHFHNSAQIVFVLKGEVRQGNRVFTPGMGYSTPAEQPYTITAGADGCEVVEVRSDPITELTITWTEGDPAKWQRGAWDKATA